MARYIVRRLLWIVVLLIVVSFITFLFFYIFPSSDPALLRAGRQATPQLIAEIRHQFGFDDPWYVQYFHYMKNLILHGDFGYSYYSNASVSSLIFDRIPTTIQLTVGAVILWLAVGLSVGTISAIKRGTWLDRAAMGGALLGISAPVYWLGLVLLYLFANDIGLVHIFPGLGSYTPMTQNLGKWFTSLILPWIVLAAAFSAIYARLLRSNLIETMQEDYIRTARAKGLRERRVIFRHGVRSAITPIITILGIDIGVLLGGAVLTETVFNIPGVGRLAYDAISHGDLPIIQGVVLMGAFFIVVANLLVDIAYAFLDPRVRYS